MGNLVSCTSSKKQVNPKNNTRKAQLQKLEKENEPQPAPEVKGQVHTQEISVKEEKEKSVSQAAPVVQYNPLKPISQEDMDSLFYNAHTEHGFTDEPVDPAILRKLVELTLLPPSAYNCSPLRVLFITRNSPELKAKLVECCAAGNRQKCSEAPVVAILCTDTKYSEKLPYLMPMVQGVQQIFESDPEVLEESRVRNGNLQAAYFIMAARALGLGVGPMGGFSNKAVNEAFLADSTWTSNLLINLGYPNVNKRYPRAPRLPFNESCQVR